MTTKTIVMAACVAIFAEKAQAGQVLTGTLKYTAPGTSLSTELGYVNNFVGMENSVLPHPTYISGSQVYQLITSAYAGIPYAATPGAQTYAEWSSSIVFTAGSGFKYVLAEFRGSQYGDIDLLYYTTDGSFNIPATMSGVGTIDHYSAFQAAPPITQTDRLASVPDGGATIGLLGLGLSTVAWLRRRTQR